VVLTTGVQILRESAAELMDAVPGDALETEVRAALADVAGVRVVEEVLAHRFGPYFVVHVTIGIDGALSVRAGDDIASEVERALQSANALIRRVTVHYHPAAAA